MAILSYIFISGFKLEEKSFCHMVSQSQNLDNIILI